MLGHFMPEAHWLRFQLYILLAFGGIFWIVAIAFLENAFLPSHHVYPLSNPVHVASIGSDGIMHLEDGRRIRVNADIEDAFLRAAVRSSKYLIEVHLVNTDYRGNILANIRIMVLKDYDKPWFTFKTKRYEAGWLRGNGTWWFYPKSSFS